MKANKSILGITALAIFALATPALASYGGGSNAMTNISSHVACNTPQLKPSQFITNAIYGGSPSLLGAVVGVRPSATRQANSTNVAKMNLPATTTANANAGGSNALGENGSPMICSTVQPNS